MCAQFTIGGMGDFPDGAFTIPKPEEAAPTLRISQTSVPDGRENDNAPADVVDLSAQGRKLAASSKAAGLAGAETETEEEDATTRLIKAIDRQIEKLKERMEEIQEEIEEIEAKTMDEDAKKQMLTMKRAELAQCQAEMNQLLDQKQKAMKEQSLKDVSPESVRPFMK